MVWVYTGCEHNVCMDLEDSVSKQQRSDCVDMQANLSLQCNFIMQLFSALEILLCLTKDINSLLEFNPF